MDAGDGAPSEYEKSIARLSESWMALFGMGAPKPPGSEQGTAGDFRNMQANLLGFAAVFAEPLRSFVESQQELSKQVTDWANSQRDLAEIAAAWAASQRKFADLLSSWLPPGSVGRKDD